MGDAGGEGTAVEQRGGQHVERIEPAAGLPDVLHDEVAREVALEPLAVLEGVVHLGEGHGAGLEPAVQDVRDAAHHRPPRGIVRVGAHQGVDEGAVQVGDLRTEVRLQLGEGAVDVRARVGGVVAHPHRDRGAPEAVARDRPVAGTGQPVAEDAVLDVAGVPVDVLVELHHTVADRGDLDEPGGDRLVDQGPAAAPAVRVGVHVALLLHQDGASGRFAAGQRSGGVTQVGDDRLVGVEDLEAGVVADLGGEAASVVHGDHGADAGLLADEHVVLTEGGGDVHQAGAVLGGDEVGADDRPAVGAGVRALGAVGGVVEVVEDRVVATPHQLTALEAGQDLWCLAELTGVGLQARLAQDHVLAGQRGPGVLGHVDHHVVDVRADGHGEVGGQGPGRRRPDEHQLGDLGQAGARAQPLLQAQAHRDRVVLLVLVDLVVHLELVVGQRGAVVPAVGQDAVPLVGEVLVVELLEGPDDGLHVGGVEGLVVVVEVHPAGLAGDVVLPLVGVAQHGGTALGVELLDTDAAGAGDLGHVVDAEQALGLELGGQAVGVPAEAALDPSALLGLEAAHGVLDVAGQQVAVVGQPVGEGRAVVEDELVGATVSGAAVVDGGGEGSVSLPVGEHVLLDHRKGRRGLDARARAVEGVEGRPGVGAGLVGAAGHGASYRSSCVTPAGGTLPQRATRTTTTPAHPGLSPGGRVPCRGTTSLAVHRPHRRLAVGAAHDRFLASCDGLSRPALLGWARVGHTCSSGGSPVMAGSVPCAGQSSRAGPARASPGGAAGTSFCPHRDLEPGVTGPGGTRGVPEAPVMTDPACRPAGRADRPHRSPGDHEVAPSSTTRTGPMAHPDGLGHPWAGLGTLTGLAGPPAAEPGRRRPWPLPHPAPRGSRGPDRTG